MLPEVLFSSIGFDHITEPGFDSIFQNDINIIGALFPGQPAQTADLVYGVVVLSLVGDDGTKPLDQRNHPGHHHKEQ